MRTKIIFFIILIFSFLKASDLNTLLELYEGENDLSKETKKNTVGGVLVYTRQDLEKMKVSSLSELLKNIPFYKYAENTLGFTDIVYNKYLLSTSSDVRLYMNEREISSPFFGSSISLMSKLDADFIDHVEIYYNSTTFEFGIEPAKLVVSVYTKDPRRENGGNLNLKVATDKSKEGNISYGKIFDNFSVYAYANTKNTKEYNPIIDKQEISKDKKSKHFFISLKNKNHTLEYNKIQTNADIFIQGGNSTPILNEATNNYDMLAWTSNCLDKRLFINLDYIFLETDTNKRDDEPILFPIPSEDSDYRMRLKNKEYSLGTSIKYKEHLDNNDILIGAYFKRKSVKNKEFKLKPSVPWIKGDTLYEKEDIYSIFIENKYDINDRHSLLASFKYDKIHIDNHKIKKDNLFSKRFGYIYKNKDFLFKTFYSNYDVSFDQYIYYYAKMYGGDPKKIKNQKNEDITLDFIWNKKDKKYDLSLFFTKEEKSITQKYKNTTKPTYTKGISFSTSYHFDLLHRLNTNIFVANKKIKEFEEKNTFYGGSINLTNTFFVGHSEKFDLYNQLIYRGGYEDLKDGYNFNSTITYQVKKDFKVYVKGENILNKAIKTSYNIKNQKRPIKVSTKRFLLGIEYKF